jgi:hypothetical protein
MADEHTPTPDQPAKELNPQTLADTGMRPLTRSERRNIWIQEYEQQDIALALWVEWVEKFGLELPVMLQVHGLLIFGVLISTESYAAFHIQMYEEMYRENDPNTADTLAEYYRSLVPPADQPEIGPAGLPTLYNYAHLRAVTIMSGGHRVKVPYWRGKLSQVDAFVVGATAGE